MASDDVTHISEGKRAHVGLKASLADEFQELANLALDGDDHRRPAPFAGYDSEPPPAPKLHSQGIIAMDITQQFTKAAQGQSHPDLSF